MINESVVLFNERSLQNLKSYHIGQSRSYLRRTYNNVIKDSVIYSVADFYDEGIAFHDQLFYTKDFNLREGLDGSKKIVIFLKGKDNFKRFSGEVVVFDNKIAINEENYDGILRAIPNDKKYDERKLFQTISFYVGEAYVTFYFDIDFINLEGIIVNIYPKLPSHEPL